MESRLEVLAEIAADRGTPCFVYFFDDVRSQVSAIRSAFGDRFRISYAVKSNPNPELLTRLHGLIDHLDVSSRGEAILGSNCGWSPASMSFTGPAKQEEDLRSSLDLSVGHVVVESLAEAVMLDELAGRRGCSQEVLLRIAPQHLPRGFGVNMAGKPTQFGVDEEDMDAAIGQIVSLPNLELSGFHIYSGTQCLVAESIAENYEIFIDIFRRATRLSGRRPKQLVFGSGLGIPYHEGDSAIDLADVAERINPSLDALATDPDFLDCELVLETGRYLVGEAGIYLTRVVSLKHSRGVDIGICDGGMNHHLGACGHLGSVIHRNYRLFKVDVESGAAPVQNYDLVGPLCTTIDTLARKVELPRLAVGDVVAVESSGAYGITASPLNFISHPPPHEYIVETVDGEVTIVDVSEFEPREECRSAKATTGDAGH